MTNRARLIGFSLIGLAGLIGCSHFIGSENVRVDFRQTEDLRDLTTVQVETRNGSIEARCVPGASQVEISGSKSASASTEAEAREMVERIEIRVERPADRPGLLRIAAEFPPGVSGGASFHIGLPSEIGLDLRTTNASVTASGAGRDVRIATANGSIKASDIRGQVAARTSNASITIQNVAANVEAVSSNGSIRLQNVAGDHAVATTSNASIEAHDTRGDVRLTSNNGRIEWIPVSLPEKPDVRISTSNAGIRIGVPATARATLRLSTSNASVHANLTGSSVGDLRNDGSSLSATLNGGGGQIEARTANGRIDCDLIAPKPANSAAAAQLIEAPSATSAVSNHPR